MSVNFTMLHMNGGIAQNPCFELLFNLLKGQVFFSCVIVNVCAHAIHAGVMV